MSQQPLIVSVVDILFSTSIKKKIYSRTPKNGCFMPALGSWIKQISKPLWETNTAVSPDVPTVDPVMSRLFVRSKWIESYVPSIASLKRKFASTPRQTPQTKQVQQRPKMSKAFMLAFYWFGIGRESEKDRESKAADPMLPQRSALNSAPGTNRVTLKLQKFSFSSMLINKKGFLQKQARLILRLWFAILLLKKQNTHGIMQTIGKHAQFQFNTV